MVETYDDPTFDRRFTMNENLENINPKLYKKADEREITAEELDDDVTDEFDAREIFGTRNLKLTLYTKRLSACRSNHLCISACNNSLIIFCSNYILIVFELSSTMRFIDNERSQISKY